MEKNNIEILKIIRKIRDRHYEILKDKSYEEKLAFHREKAKRMRTQAKMQVVA